MLGIKVLIRIDCYMFLDFFFFGFENVLEVDIVFDYMYFYWEIRVKSVVCLLGVRF